MQRDKTVMVRRSGFLLAAVLMLGCAERRPISAAGAFEMVGEHLGAPIPRLTGESVLQDFTVAFRDGDHRIGRVRLLAESDGSVRAFLADGDGEDRWGFLALWSSVASLPTLERTVECLTGSCDIDLGVDVTDRYRFALVGFEFERIDGGDQRIRSIGISPGDPGPRLLRVTFRDDSPGDDRFRCRVQYKLLPVNRKSGLPASRSISGGNDRRSTEPLAGRAEDRVLSGFEFSYLANDAQVLSVGLNLRTGTVEFKDNDLDESISWNVTYLQLESWSPHDPDEVSQEEDELGPPGRLPDSPVVHCEPGEITYLQCSFIDTHGELNEVQAAVFSVRLTGASGEDVVLRQHCKNENVWVTVVCDPSPSRIVVTENLLPDDWYCAYGTTWARPQSGLVCGRIAP